MNTTNTTNVVTETNEYDRQAWVLVGVLVFLVIVAYFNSLIDVSHNWDEPQYSHGFLIPCFAAVLLWMRREAFLAASTREKWIGAGLIVLALALRVYGARTVNFTLDNASLVPCLIGVFCLVGGWAALRWAAGPLLFLLFMYPLPGKVNDTLLRPLKDWATQASNYALQTFGFMTFRDGNRIVMDNVMGGPDIRLGVVDACSGLRMLTIFLALCVAFAMMTTHRPLWERIVIAISAIPIAFMANVVRITLTGVLYQVMENNKLADYLFHDAAGFLMIPIAGGLLYLEYQILTRILIDAEPQGTARRTILTPRTTS